MAKTIGEVIRTAAQLKAEKQWLKALKVYRLLLEAAPLDQDVRLNIADSVMALGYEDLAAFAYAETCKYCAKAGYPLHAIVAAKKGESIKGGPGRLLEEVAELYCMESQTRARMSRIAPIDPEIPVKDNVNLNYPIETKDLIQNTLQIMVATAKVAPLPASLPPIPILSDLPKEPFLQLLREVKLLTLEGGSVVIREGEEATTFYMIAKGQVVVYKGEGPGRGKRLDIARLGQGSVFGEMALITQSPRTATVETVEETELLEFNKEKLDNLSADSVVIEAALERFTRERLISNLLATNPIFRPFDRKQRYELLSRFTAHEVTPGTVLVREGQVGRGLYILLYGQAEVTKRENGQKVLLATLRSGDMFGEISLIKETPTTASVEALSHCTILFLPKEYFQRLVESIGDLKQFFDKLSDERISMTVQALERARALEEEEIVFEDELILI